jgi:branched-chain amino acid transport system permease protein
MTAALTPRNAVIVVLMLLLAAVPVYAAVTANTFLVTLFTRVIILGMAATSLNLILGYGGMVSFGHAVYLGIGGYAVGILAQEGASSGFLQWPVAILVSALFALLVGALSLRTRGVYFIMITLAFAQLVYYFGVGLDRYGADDGLTIRTRSQFAGLLNLSDRAQFYYLCLALLVVTIYLIARLVNSRFGMVIQGARSNDRRMRAIGFATFRYRLTAFVIAGAICGLAGALLANHTGFISPATMHWTRSGDLIVMVVLGGMGSAFGPLFLLVVLFARGGIDGLLAGARRG